MWTHVTAAFLQVSWLEPKFSFPVTPRLALFGQLHEIPGAKKQNRGTNFKWCVPTSWVHLLSRMEYVWVYRIDLNCRGGWHSFNRKPKATWVQPTPWPQGISQSKCSAVQGGILSGHNFPNFDFWDTKIFSESIPLGYACGLASGRGF